MSGYNESANAVSEIRVTPQQKGVEAVFLVAADTQDEAEEIKNIFIGLGSSVMVQELCEGKLLGFAVQTDESESMLLDEIDGVLKDRCEFVLYRKSFDESIYKIVCELVSETNGTLVPISHCDICGRPDPFPTTMVHMTDDKGSVIFSRSYCGSCTAQIAEPNNKGFVRSLLAADKESFGDLEQAELVRQPSRKQPLRFKIKG